MNKKEELTEKKKLTDRERMVLARERVAKMKWVKCRALANVGYPSFPRKYQPLADRKDETVFPKHEGGAFRIVKGKEYNVREDSIHEEWFEPIKSKGN